MYMYMCTAKDYFSTVQVSDIKAFLSDLELSFLKGERQ